MNTDRIVPASFQGARHAGEAGHPRRLWSFRSAFICVYLWFQLFGARPGWAQGSINSIFPNGAQRGTTVELKLAGEKLPETAELFVEGDGIKPLGPFAKGVGKVEVAA